MAGFNPPAEGTEFWPFVSLDPGACTRFLPRDDLCVRRGVVLVDQQLLELHVHQVVARGCDVAAESGGEDGWR